MLTNRTLPRAPTASCSRGQTGSKSAKSSLTYRCAIALILVLTSECTADPVLAAGFEYRIKAVFLFHFAQLTDWPSHAFPSPTAVFTIGLVGDDPFGQALQDAVRHERINDRPIVIKQAVAESELTSCHLLFVARSEKNRLNTILEAVHGSPVLTVSDIEGFAQKGGIIELTIESQKVRFEVDTGTASTAGLVLSSKILKLAKAIRGPAPTGALPQQRGKE